VSRGEEGMKDKLKVFVSVDIEGITGVVHWDETESGKSDYPYFRKLMASETNAAVEALFESGASEVIVRDAHGSALNILPDALHKDAKLIRNWVESPFGMMDGLDDSFDAVLFIGYHAKAGTPNATLKHTMNTGIMNLKINGISLSEGGYNSLIAGYFGVPVIFVSGDSAFCDHSKTLWPDIETVAVKEGIGNACISIHPEVARERIKSGVLTAMKNRDKFKPYKLAPPFSVELTFRRERSAYRASWYPQVERINEFTVCYKNNNFMDCLRFFYFSESL